MKHYFIPAILATLIVFSSCGNKGKTNGADSLKGDTTGSLVKKDSVPADTNVLENLLSINSEKNLIAKFGKARVKYDTVWGAEGMYTMGSYLDKGTTNEVQFNWNDSAGRSGIGSVVITLPYDADPAKPKNTWHSKSGIKLGMPVADVQTINGHQFKFSGIGWDYGGALTDWEKGKMDNAGVGLTFDADYNVHSSEKDYNSVSGEQDVMSDAPAVKTVGIRVVQINVYNPPK